MIFNFYLIFFIISIFEITNYLCLSDIKVYDHCNFSVEKVGENWFNLYTFVYTQVSNWHQTAVKLFCVFCGFCMFCVFPEKNLLKGPVFDRCKLSVMHDIFH